jgi:hypothetical protein
MLALDSIGQRSGNVRVYWTENGEVVFPGSTVWTSNSRIQENQFEFQHSMDSTLLPVIRLRALSNCPELFWNWGHVSSLIDAHWSISPGIVRNLPFIRIGLIVYSIPWSARRLMPGNFGKSSWGDSELMQLDHFWAIIHLPLWYRDRDNQRLGPRKNTMPGHRREAFCVHLLEIWEQMPVCRNVRRTSPFEAGREGRIYGDPNPRADLQSISNVKLGVERLTTFSLIHCSAPINPTPNRVPPILAMGEPDYADNNCFTSLTLQATSFPEA